MSRDKSGCSGNKNRLIVWRGHLEGDAELATYVKLIEISYTSPDSLMIKEKCKERTRNERVLGTASYIVAEGQCNYH